MKHLKFTHRTNFLSGWHASRCLMVDDIPALHQTGREWTTNIITCRCMVSLKTCYVSKKLQAAACSRVV